MLNQDAERAREMTAPAPPSISTGTLSRQNNRNRLPAIIAVLERDGNLCQGCLTPFKHIDDMEIDHIDNDIGHNCLDNKQLLCSECNNPYNKAAIFGNRAKGLPPLCERARPCPCGYMPVTLRVSAPVVAQALELAPMPERARDSMPLDALDGEQAVTKNGNGRGQTQERNGAIYIKDQTIHAILKNIAEGKPGSEGLTPLPDPVEAKVLQESKEDQALTPTMRKNKKCEGPFNKWLNELLAKGYKYDFKVWQAAGAKEFDCSPDTTFKYLDKRTNPLNGDLKTYFDEDGQGGKITYLDFRAKHES